jgi:chemotaxis-related protein WspB
MLLILFHAGSQRYGIPSDQVAQVLPLADLRPLPHAEPGMTGLLSFHGDPVPVLDLSRLLAGSAAPALLSTRILLVRFPCQDGTVRLLGLLAEQVTGTATIDPAKLSEPGYTPGTAAFLGPVWQDAHGMLQVVKVEKLIPPETQARLFQRPEPSTA